MEDGGCINLIPTRLAVNSTAWAKTDLPSENPGGSTSGIAIVIGVQFISLSNVCKFKRQMRLPYYVPGQIVIGYWLCSGADNAHRNVEWKKK